MEKVRSSWPVSSAMHGLRADQCLKRHIGRISRARAQRIIKAQEFLLDGEPVKLSLRVKVGQMATLIREAPDDKTDIHKFDIKIVYEDSNILVINKPYGVSIHPSANCLYKTLTHWLRLSFPGQKINPCHRIDKETSGLVICAKNRLFEAKIKGLFMRGGVKKTYLAVVEGQFVQAQIINKPLALQGSRGLVAIRMIEDPKGKEATTKIRPFLYSKKRQRSLVFCRPYTGRQHQIRAHLSLIGHAIIGDKIYCHGESFFDSWCKGEISEGDLIHPRHALHARSLSFRLDKFYHFKCAIPEDFYQLIE